MMMIIGPRNSSGAHDFRAPLDWRAPIKVFFRGRMSADSWTPGPKPLCHRRPTGPHPSGLSWTSWSPAKGDSTKSNCAPAQSHNASGAQRRHLLGCHAENRREDTLGVLAVVGTGASEYPAGVGRAAAE